MEAGLFLNNKYVQCYFRIIEKRKSNPVEGYCERHHIIPKCMCGSDEEENLVELTAREHFIVHLLLTKMTVGSIRRKLIHAVWLMTSMRSKNQQRYIVGARMYARIRALHSVEISEYLRGRKKKNTENYKKPKSKSHSLNISLGRMGINFSVEHRNCLSLVASGKIGITNGQQNKLVRKEELQSYLNTGWIRGRSKIHSPEVEQQRALRRESHKKFREKYLGEKTAA